jgi:PH domain
VLLLLLSLSLSCPTYIMQDHEAAGTIPVDASSVVFAEDRTKKKYCFEVSTRFRNFFLYAENELEMASWMDVIKAASNNQDNAKVCVSNGMLVSRRASAPLVTHV